MYCEKCGTKKESGKCPICDLGRTVPTSFGDYYLFIATIASIIIIRLLTQQKIVTHSTTSWVPGATSVSFHIPDNIVGVIIVLLVASALILAKMASSEKYKRSRIILYLVAELIIGYYTITLV